MISLSNPHGNPHEISSASCRFYRRGDLLGAQLTAVRLGSGASTVVVADVALGVDSWMRKVPGWDGHGFV